MRQEPFGRSVAVRPLGWRPSPKRYKPGVKPARGTVEGIHVRYCQPLQSGDGYTYMKGATLPPQA